MLMDLEAGTFKNNHGTTSWKTVLMLAYQSFGVVYGDLSTSPLYVYKSTFSGRVKISDNDAEILGVLSFILWTITLVPVVKYIFLVLRADDNGEGGTFALYSLLCRHAKLSLLPNQQAVDQELSTYKLGQPPKTDGGSAVKSFLEQHSNLRFVLLIGVLLGTCMVIGDGVLTPTISVLSAVSGIKVASNHLEEHVVVVLSCLILLGLFALQHYGTHKVGFMFAPIVIAWLFCISTIGIYNIIHWNPGVVKALSPYHMYNFFKKTGKDGWIALGGVALCITGAEAMFADLGHFSQLSIKIAFTFVVYPCLILAYMGQAAFLSRNQGEIEHSFYASIPKPVFWPVFVVATLASVVGSQAIISATFSIINQCLSLGCFPRVKVVHTSKHIHGQIYIPEINWILMVLCLAITIGFRDTTLIGNAYGLAVMMVMLVTTCLMSLVIIVVWHKNLFLALSFLIFFGSIECLYISASIIKVPQGGWVPLILAMVFMAVMYIWHYGIRKKYEFDMHNKVSMKWLLTLGPSLGIVRVPGIGLIYTELVTGVPAIFSHFVTNLPAFHQILVFVCIKSVPVPYVPSEERFLIGRIGPKEYHMYRCIVRYGYKDFHKDDYDFENQLVLNIGEFIQTEAANSLGPSSSDISAEGRLTLIGTPVRGGIKLLSIDSGVNDDNMLSLSLSHSNTLRSFQDLEESHSARFQRRKKVRFELPTSPGFDPSVRDKLIELVEAKEAGIAYILGHSYVKAKKNSSLLKRFAIDVVYNFLRKNCRGPSVALSIPHICLIEVGMIYYV